MKTMKCSPGILFLEYNQIVGFSSFVDVLFQLLLNAHILKLCVHLPILLCNVFLFQLKSAKLIEMHVDMHHIEKAVQ